MKKTIFLLAFIVFVFIGYQFYKLNRTINLKNTLQLIEKPSQYISEKLPQGADLNKPLKIPSGFRIAVFAQLGKDSPRVMTFDSKENLIVSLTNSGKVVVLPDKDKNGQSDEEKTLISGLNKPHGLVQDANYLYIAESDKVVRYNYDSANLKVSDPVKLFSLPGGGRHFTRTIKVFDQKIYTSVGSSCDVCVENDWRRASILVSDLDGGNLKTYASGLRNTVFFVFDASGKIWGNDMGRDYLGDNLPPDEVNIIQNGGDYGWPYCFGDQVKDTKFSRDNQHGCANVISPVYKYPAHVAPLGIALIDSQLFAKEEQGNILASFHGSWNSTKPVGYKIVKLKIQNGKVVEMNDFIDSWITDTGTVLGRPVDLIFDKSGVLYISDDKANLIYILTK